MLNYRNINPGDIVQGKRTGTFLRVLSTNRGGMFVEGYSSEISYNDVQPVYIYPLKNVELLKDIILGDYRESLFSSGKVYEFWFGDYKALAFSESSEEGKVKVTWSEYHWSPPTVVEIMTDRLSDVQDLFFQVSSGLREMPIKLPELPKLKWRCLGCGRVMENITPHRCGANFRKHHLNFESLIL